MYEQVRRLAVFLVLALTACATSTNADETPIGMMVTPTWAVLLFDRPCETAAVLENAPEDKRHLLKQGRAEFHPSKKLPAIDGCWLFSPEKDRVGWIDEKGDGFIAPAEEFGLAGKPSRAPKPKVRTWES